VQPRRHLTNLRQIIPNNAFWTHCTSPLNEPACLSFQINIVLTTVFVWSFFNDNAVTTSYLTKTETALQVFAVIWPLLVPSTLAHVIFFSDMCTLPQRLATRSLSSTHGLSLHQRKLISQGTALHGGCFVTFTGSTSL